MSFDSLGDLNWLAVIVAALAYFALGGLWYSPVLFGNKWMAAAGMTMEGEGPGPSIYAAPLVSCVIAAIATGMLAEATGTETFGEGLVLGLVIAVGFAATLIGVTAMFESNKPDAKTWGIITAGYHVVGLVLVGAILGAWT